ncbi:heat shock 70 kDa protein 12A-like [Mercenaria mercenaria]|uniref:heat shock 70 kDa protein 12A-like n=1 Tax=Mercenaria mercenaria TaxID=6596 RepID=UPI00234EFE80|nr:heat shock 70 kDa protein 12A-like [Mercenaria mercenaria]
MAHRVVVQTRKSGQLIVAAIDFGTTYSGYAYSFKDHYQRDPLQIFSHSWVDGYGLCTLKVPTTVLFDKAGDFNAFGYEAEEKYAELSSSDKHIGWKYFRHFKMTLHNRPNLTLKTKLRDDQGKTMPAIKIFSAAIKYLKTHLFNKLTESYYNRQQSVKGNSVANDVYINIDDDILWILTVPSIWSDSAKQFMRVAAVQAGIPEGQLFLALEPEAAAIFTKTAVLSTNNSDETGAFENDSQFMVIDLGGGTVDITVHKVQNDGKLHEVYPPSGGPWGGTLVDDHIYEFLENLFGRKVLEKLKTESTTETLDMHRTLELKKRQFRVTDEDDGKVNLTVPGSLYEIYEEENREERFLDRLERLYSNKVQKKWGRLIIDQNIFHKLFTESIDNLTEHLVAICRRHDMAGVNTFVLVGGYSECDVLKQSIKDIFTDKHMIIPEEASSAVAKGAVLFGHDPDIIDSRRAPCTYGISTAVPFDSRVHPAKHRHRDMCEDVFKVFIPVGTEIVPGKTQVAHSFNTAKSSSVEIYKSISEHPSFITDPGCEKVGEIDISGTAGESTRVDIIMKFGDTELHVEAKEQETGNKISAKFNFLR